MSFEWLNVPGINTADNDVTVEQGNNLPPPSVSFDIGTSGSNAEQKTDLQPIGNENGPNVPRGSGNHLGDHRPIAQHHHSYLGSDQQKQNDNIQVHHHHKQGQNPHSHTDMIYKETPEELRVPLSLSRSQLTKEEVRTYLRWYNFITSRTHSKLVKLIEVFKFLANFRLSHDLKTRIEAIFRTCKNALNIGQFFAVLRLISKALIENVIPNRRMILDKAPIPTPRPILTSGDRHEVYEEVDEEPDSNGQKVDFDSFASLLLTGKSVQKRIRRRIPDSADKNKRVRFSEHVTFQEPPSEDGEENGSHEVSDDEEADGKMDLSLPMDQLLKRMAKRKEKNTALVSSMPNEQQETEEEREVLEDMKDSLSHFKQIQSVDLASMPTIRVSGNEPEMQPLKPTSTGSANSLFRQHYNNQSSAGAYQEPLQPLKPTATGSANYLMRNHIPPHQEAPSEAPNGPSPVTGLQPLRPTATGSGNYLMKQQLSQHYAPSGLTAPMNSAERFPSPQHTGQLPTDSYLHAPQPRISMQQQLSPQVTPQSQNFQQQHNMLPVPPNPAGSYFQSLLSNSPSPVPSNVNISGINNSSSPYQNPPNSNPPTSQSRAMYNNGYQYSNTAPNRQMFNEPAQQQNYPQQNFSSPYPMPSSTSPQSGDILSDLHSLQQQVNALQNSYRR